MEIYITFDYEVFLGPNVGSVDKCLIEPTNNLIKLARKHKVHFVFFIDVLFLLKMEEYKELDSSINADYLKIITQLYELFDDGHDLQLHIHPHWYYSIYDINRRKWSLDYTHYKLSDCSFSDIEIMFINSVTFLSKITGRKITTYRAGGYSLPNNVLFFDMLNKYGILNDSSVFMLKKEFSDFQYYDYSTIKEYNKYSFNNDIQVECDKGCFTEFPISSIRINPICYYIYTLVIKLLNRDTIEIGDGKGVGDFNNKWKRVEKYYKRIISYVVIPASVDSIYSFWIKKIKKTIQSKSQNLLVIIGHPKRQTVYSIRNLDKFLSNLSKDDSVKTFYQ